jgi:hypothetical protein
MKDTRGMIRNVALVTVVLSLAIFGSGLLGNGTFFGAKIVFGYGGGGGGGGGGSYIPPIINAIGVPLTIGPSQAGTLTYNLGGGSVKLEVPKGAVSGTTTFKIIDSSMSCTEPSSGSAIDGTYIINAADSSSNRVSNFSSALTITLGGLVLPADVSNVGAYYYNEATSEWVLIPGATIDPAAGTATFTVNHLTKFTVLNVAGRPSTVRTLTPVCRSGTLVKGSFPAVYYCGADCKRYVFPNEKTYKTWYSNFSSVIKISDTNLAKIQVGGNVTYRPGVKMIKISINPKVYAVSKGGVLRPIKDEATATALYGSNWSRMIDDVSEIFFTNYTIGSAVNSAGDYNKDAAMSSSLSINMDKGLSGN